MDLEDSQARVPSRKKLRRRRQKLLAIEMMHDYGQNTTLHGLRYATDQGLSLVEKLFWIVTFMVSLSLCILLMHNVWVKWQTSPVIVALSEQLVSVGEVPFPSVTICPQIKAKRSVYNFSRETTRVMKDIALLNLTTDEINRDPEMNKFEDVGLICWVESILKKIMRNYSDATVVYNLIEVSPNITDIFYGCRMHHKEISCSSIFSPVLTMEGVCFTMNTLAADEIFRKDTIQKDYAYLNTSEPSKGWSPTEGYSSPNDDVYPRRGKDNGAEPDFSMILRETPKDRDGLCNGINRGYKVYLQHPADMPQSGLYYYAALPKQTSSLALKFSILNTSSTLKDYSPKTRQCYFPQERQLRYFRTYTSNNCRLECLSNYTFQHCGCVWFNMPHNDSSAVCREGRKTCVLIALEKFASEEGHSDSKVGKCQCLPSCVGIQYEAEILKTKFEANVYIHALKNVFSQYFPDDITDNDPLDTDILTQIEIYYKESRFVSMRRSELFGLTDFLANCGGLLGLFLGFSFLSLVEVFYFCTLRLGCTFRRNKKLAEKNSNTQIYTLNSEKNEKSKMSRYIVWDQQEHQ